MLDFLTTRRSVCLCAALVATLFALTSAVAPAMAQTYTKFFDYKGSEWIFEVPDNVTSIEIEAVGGNGGEASGGAISGGVGAKVIGTVAVTPGQKLYVVVGGDGHASEDLEE